MKTVTPLRLRVRVDGVVQGVGFRPYVHRLAAELGLAGFVLNDERGVVVEVEGEADAVRRFVVRLPREAPPLAHVHAVEAVERPVVGERRFAIVASGSGGEPLAPVTPDAATCDDCLRELFDPRDRRFRYPFVNCTNCGPRFTIVCGVPYDRPRTTMAGFTMCPACRAEYEDPSDRRFHAQPNACPDCGPTLRLLPGSDPNAQADRSLGSDPFMQADRSLGSDPFMQADRSLGSDPLVHASEAVVAGAIVAVKGLGGFHLACRADDERAVAALRSRKHREDKPFALMVADVEAARELVELAPGDEALLRSHERPIVVAPRRPGAAVAGAVAPHSADLGVILPYTPLHHLLLADAGVPLVVTSGNASEEPIAYRDEDALRRLAGIADLFLLHDRPIRTRTDDSVIRSGGVFLRRSRGYVPGALELPVPAPRPLLACGADLKAAFCVAKRGSAWVSHHIGDLEDYGTFRAYEEGVAHFEELFAVAPEVVVHDLHPDYRSTAFALSRDGVETVAVQHHHAHLASCLAEHGDMGPAVGAIFDGTGYGPDGTIWGGELLVGDLRGFERAGHLLPVRLPGGDRAAREPWRMACAWLTAAGEEGIPASLREIVDPTRWRAVASMARTGTAAPWTTSAGRLFDAVAALCGVRAVASYEGQAAIELESLAAGDECAGYELPVAGDDPLVLDARPLVVAVARDVAAGVPPAVVAGRFHAGLADATAEACVRLAAARGLDVAVVSGGVFGNRRLLERTCSRLEAAGLRVLRPRRLPANDGGVAYGQAAIAAAVTAC